MFKRVTLLLVLKGTAKLFFRVMNYVTFQLSMYERSSFSAFSPAFSDTTLFYFSCSDWCVVIFHCDFIDISLMANNVQKFLCAYQLNIYSTLP